MSKNTILMPVIAICDECKDCPELKIGVSKTEIHNMEDTCYSNTIYCEYYEKCKRLLGATLNKYNKYNSTSSD